jgi:SAM-dependent methyltransferase
MNCFICQGSCVPYFSKSFAFHGLSLVEYVKCTACGLVISKTHFEMPQSQWERLNEAYHAAYLGTTASNDDPRWLERLDQQRSLIEKFYDAGVIAHQLPWLDYGCGDGKLSQLLAERQLSLLNFDRYCIPSVAHQSKVYLSEVELSRTKYDLVVSTSVFEHVRSIETLDEMNRLVSPNGVFAIHTWAGATVPVDPGWFYLLPVHCVFYSNRSMQLLFRRWGYAASVYHVGARMWLWFRKPPVAAIQDAVARFNAAGGFKEFFYKEDFVDYWQ